MLVIFHGSVARGKMEWKHCAEAGGGWVGGWG